MIVGILNFFIKISNIRNKRQEILVFLQPIGFRTASGIMF